MSADYSEIILNSKNKVVGLKQTIESLKKGQCKIVVVAVDSELDYKHKIFAQAAKNNDAKVVQHFSRQQLAKFCGVDVKTGVVGILE